MKIFREVCPARTGNEVITTVSLGGREAGTMVEMAFWIWIGTGIVALIAYGIADYMIEHPHPESLPQLSLEERYRHANRQYRASSLALNAFGWTYGLVFFLLLSVEQCRTTDYGTVCDDFVVPFLFFLSLGLLLGLPIISRMTRPRGTWQTEGSSPPKC